MGVSGADLSVRKKGTIISLLDSKLILFVLFAMND